LEATGAMPIEFSQEQHPVASLLVVELEALSESIFAVAVGDIGWRLENMPYASVFSARDDNKLVGFKAGYAMSQSKYYSWLGGVRQDYRRQGIASELMRLQHIWLCEQGFQVIETSANEENITMAAANLRHGFVACGIRREPHRVQVLFNKSLI
jgi:ribosomal protein S18 acetylase RimI-like enzyme